MSMDPSASPAPEKPAAGGTLDAMAEALKIAAGNEALASEVDASGQVSCELNEDDGSIVVSSGDQSITVRADEILADDPDDDGDEAALAGVMGG